MQCTTLDIENKILFLNLEILINSSLGLIFYFNLLLTTSYIVFFSILGFFLRFGMFAVLVGNRVTGEKPPDKSPPREKPPGEKLG